VPLYEYECRKCGRHTDKIEPVNGPHLKKCPHCGGKVESVITAPAIKFKGSGWYVTDYAGKTALGETPEKSGSDKGEKESSEKSDNGKSEKSDKDKKDSAAKDSSSKESKSSKEPAKESRESKPAKKK
jgi:putative FmdB family regulatory protein